LFVAASVEEPVASGQNLQPGKTIRANLQQPARVGQLMDFFTDLKKLSGSRNRSATLGRSQFKNSASARLCASTVLPVRRGPASQTRE
jgi:hypothetical protein